MAAQNVNVTLWDNVCLATMTIAGLGPILLGAGAAYFILQYLGKTEYFSEVFSKPLASLTLNDIVSVSGQISLYMAGAWIGKNFGMGAMNSTERFLLGIENWAERQVGGQILGFRRIFTALLSLVFTSLRRP